MFGILVVVAVGLVAFSLGVVYSERTWRMEMAEDFSKLTAAVTKLQADVTTLIASKEQNNQAAIDVATAAVTAVDDAVVAATPAPPAA